MKKWLNALRMKFATKLRENRERRAEKIREDIAWWRDWPLRTVHRPEWGGAGSRSSYAYDKIERLERKLKKIDLRLAA